jgi:hypothetical protein
MGVFITFGTILGWMVASLVFGVDLAPLLIVAAVLAISVPVVTYPMTYTVWQGIDLLIRAPSQEDIAEAEKWLAEQSQK